MNAQSGDTLLWGHPAFFDQGRSDDDWVVVGHQPMEEPYLGHGQIAVDTGAVYGGQLTAVRITPDGDIDFIGA